MTFYGRLGRGIVTMQKEKKFEKIKKLLHQFKMRKVRFEEITYIKVKNIDDYIDLRNSIEKCFIDKKGFY